jgi:hypothetical protein
VSRKRGATGVQRQMSWQPLFKLKTGGTPPRILMYDALEQGPEFELHITNNIRFHVLVSINKAHYTILVTHYALELQRTY